MAMSYYTVRMQLDNRAIDRARASVRKLGRELQERMSRYSRPKLYVWASDLHVHSADIAYEDEPGSEFYEKLVDTRRQLALALHEIHAIEPEPACVILGGDLTDHGFVGEYRALHEVLSNRRWNIPTMPVFGNHDSSRAPLNPDLRDAWPEVKLANWPDLCDADEFYYAWEDDAVRFIVLDTKQQTSYRMSERQQAWLRQQLAVPDGTPPYAAPKPIIVLCHRHQLPVGNWVDEVSRFRDKAVWELLDSCPRVAGVLSGHVHAPQLWQYRRKLYCTFPAVAYGIGAQTGWGGFVVAEGAIKDIFMKSLAGESYDLLSEFSVQAGEFSFLKPELFQNHPLCNPLYWPWEEHRRDRD